jgi:predicted ATPase/DNA-binding CsgD family transcriptional regulator/DNA-binding XRE family transcriptional regulator
VPERPARTGFAAQLRRLRLRAGLTQEALAEKAGVSVATIGAIEEGQRRRPYPHTLRALADSLELSAADRTALMSASAPATEKPEDSVSAALQVALPVALTALIGREREVAAARTLLLPPLKTPAVRLLTLLGPGGVGKTRLSLEIAATVRGGYVDGVAFVDLAPIRDHRLVPATMARALGVRESGGRSAWELLLMHLRSRRALLVLDNFEHLPGAAPLLTELLGACSALALLVTSRTALRLRGEHRMAIGPLATPAANERPTLADVAAYPAVRLFVDRVRQVSAEFNLDDNNVAAVAEICRRLDGIPLALELAAARMQLLSPAALLHRLDDRLSLLSSGHVDLPERQRTLRNTLAWSYDLLDATDRALFGRLAVFAGGWTLDAAEAICADADSQGQPECAVQLLSKADALATSIGGQLLPFEADQYESAMTSMRERLEPAAWARAWDEGQRLSLDEAIRRVEALALSAPPVAAAAEITPRQQDILRLLSAGQTNREIAAALALSLATVERHLAHLYKRIGARGRADATLYAVRVGLVTPGRPAR